jgi:hypothetical protein
MAFQPQELKIVPTGINLVPPGDQVAPGDCLELTGWWPGSVGRLQQARGWVLKNSQAVGHNLDSLCECNGRIYYGGSGYLHQIGRDTAGAAIDSGYDGYPLGLCAFQDLLWSMNTAKQTRDDGTAVRPWAVEVPGTPALAAGTAGGLQDGLYDYYITFVDTPGYEGNPSAAAAIATGAGETGWSWSENSAQVTEGSATVIANGFDWPTDVVGQTFQASGYQENYTVSSVAGSTLTLSWPYDEASDDNVSYFIFRSAAVQNGSPNVTLNSGVWATDLDGWTFQVAGDTVGYTVESVDGPILTLTTPYAGETNWAAAYNINTAGGETNASTVTITRPTPVDAGWLQGWNVYRLSPGAGSIYQVNETLIPIGTTAYVDYGDAAHDQDQATLIENDVVMEDDHDAPPAAKIMASAVYNGRLVVGNSAANPNRLWWTDALQPHYFPGSNDPQSGNWVDVGNDTGDGILNISVRQGMLLVYREKSIWAVVGDLPDAVSDSGGSIYPLVPTMGAVGPRAVVGTSNGDLAVVRQGEGYGVYRVTDWEQRIGAKIEPVLNGLGSECYLPINPAQASQCALGYNLGRLWVSYPETGNSYPNRVLICDVEQDSFNFSVSGRWFSRYASLGAFLHSVSYFAGAGSQGEVLSLEDGTNGENGSATACAYQSAYQDCGQPDHEKTWGDLVVSHKTGGATFYVTIKTDKGADSFTLASLSSTALTRQVIPLLYPTGHANAGLPIVSFNLAVRITGSGPLAFPGAYFDTPILLHYLVKPRLAMTWDSGPTDHGMTGAKVVDAMEVDFEGGALLLYIQTDIPGGVLTERTPSGTGIAIAASSGRQAVRVILPSALAGRIYRYKLEASTSTGFRLYRVRARALPVGMFVDGGFGDTWFTEPIAAGV